METILRHYLENINEPTKSVDLIHEVEVRFGNIGKSIQKYKSVSKNGITKVEYDNVIKQLYATGFKEENTGIQMLRTYGETRDGPRLELVGVELIQEYCETNDIITCLENPAHSTPVPTPDFPHKIKITQKMKPKTKNGEVIEDYQQEDFNFRVAYKYEKDIVLYNTAIINHQSPEIKNMLQTWKSQKKIFRYMKRVRYSHPDYPFFADCTILKSTTTPHYSIQESGVMNEETKYEIELEIDNRKVGIGRAFQDINSLTSVLRKGIRIVLSALQGSIYPISYAIQDKILLDYLQLLYTEVSPNLEIGGNLFLGPASKTLQIYNIVENSGEDIPNIRKGYTVTDKVDGERKLLFISGEGKIYWIDVNMKVSYTGCSTKRAEYFNSLLDGEQILYDRNKQFIHWFACFDIYFIRGKNVGHLPFTKTEGREQEPDTHFRLFLLDEMIRGINDTIQVENQHCQMTLCLKTFYGNGPNFNRMNSHYIQTTDIFEGCKQILEKKTELFPYETDGLIFTPANMAVGNGKQPAFGRTTPVSSENWRITWEESFKWKPSQFNTIDFLVNVVKQKNGVEEIHRDRDGHPYKTLILRCGFNPDNNQFYVASFQNMLKDIIPNDTETDYYDPKYRKNYKPVRFVPSNPYNPKAYFCNIPLINKDMTDATIKAEDGEIIEDNMIVEFQYDIENGLEETRRWKPLRVRHDKTSQLRKTFDNFGNSYPVANNNWYSIHHPITEIMLSSGKEIPESSVDDTIQDVYYNRKGIKNVEMMTKPLRDFHNRYVKSVLIQTAVRAIKTVQTHKTILDYAVGKAGDLSKWTISREVGFVFGIDISKDNIENAMDGAAQRYLQHRVKNPRSPFRAIFLQGNSSLNIRNGDAFSNERDKQIAKAILGEGPAPQEYKLVKEKQGIGKDGFHVSSCQFAIHYFFETAETLHGFLKNVCQNTAPGGFFVGTCFDGQTVFNRLTNKSNLLIMRNNGEENEKMFEIQKLYSSHKFDGDATSLGYKVRVYQETINKEMDEYLVHFDYLQRLMVQYGFDLLPLEEAKEWGLPNSTGLFEELYIKMMSEKHLFYGEAPNISEKERTISFLNRYFIFRKNRVVDAEGVARRMINMQIPTTPDFSPPSSPKQNKKFEPTTPEFSPPSSPKKQPVVSTKKKSPEPKAKSEKTTKTKKIKKAVLIVKPDTPPDI